MAFVRFILYTSWSFSYFISFYLSSFIF